MLIKLRIMMCIVLLIAGVGWSPPADAARAPRTQTLKNGLKLILLPDAQAGGVDVTVWYDAGARDETEGRTGLTHVVEQLMFRGSAGFASGEHQRLVQHEGGTVGTHSTHDFSSFYQTVPPEALELVFKLEADRMQSLAATEADLEEVRRLVDLGRRRSGATPVAYGLIELFAKAFEGHPYAWPAIGRAEDLPSITLGDCRAYHADRYGPGNAVVTVVGRFDAGDALAAARRTLEKTPKRETAQSPVLRLPAQTAERRTITTYEFPAPSLFVGWRVPGGGSADLAALDVATHALASSATSRLNEALVGREAMAAFVQGGLEMRKDAGMLYTVVVLTPGSDSTALAAVEARVLQEIQRFVEEPIDGEEFAAIRREIENATWLGRQRPRDLAMALGTAHFVAGDVRSADKHVAALERLKPEDVSRVAGLHLTEANRTVIWMQPDSGAAQGVNR